MKILCRSNHSLITKNIIVVTLPCFMSQDNGVLVYFMQSKLWGSLEDLERTASFRPLRQGKQFSMTKNLKR
jgi:hypothetical protein